jgi:hypothetical protein
MCIILAPEKFNQGVLNTDAKYYIGLHFRELTQLNMFLHVLLNFFLKKNFTIFLKT